MKRADHLPAGHCSNTKTTKPSCLSTSSFHLLPERRAAILCRLIKTLPCFLLSLIFYTGCFSQGSPFPNPSSPWYDWNHPVFLAYRDSVAGVHAWQNGSYRNIKIIVSDSQSRMFYAFTRFGDLYDSARVSQELYNEIAKEELPPLTPFNLKNQWQTEILQAAIGWLRQHGDKQPRAPQSQPTSNAILPFEQTAALGLADSAVRKAATTLEKIRVLEESQRKLMLDSQLLNLEIKHDQYYHPVGYQQGQVECIEKNGDSLLRYYNPDANSDITTITLNPRKEELAVQNYREDTLTLLALKKGTVPEIIKKGINPFLLYRGYLEWQLQAATEQQQRAELHLRKTSTLPLTIALGEESKEKAYWQAERQSALQQQQNTLQQIAGYLRPAQPFWQEALICVGNFRSYNLDVDNFTVHRLFLRGDKRYELTDHRGNVVAVISDRKIGIDKDGDGLIDYWVPEIISARDYYSSGAEKPGRTYDKEAYPYGYNGKEQEDGDGLVQYDYGHRIYDPRLSRFLSVDPLTESYPWYTPYQFAGNKPIWATDLDGLEEYIKQYKYEDGKATQLRIIKNSEVQIHYTGSESFTTTLTDKRTGKLFNPSELGQVQYQYFDGKGNKLNIRRDYDGNYVHGSNEMMPLGTNNYFGAIYIGPSNPTYKDINGKPQPDYRREPQDEVDAAAEQHDKAYDAIGAAGAGDAFFNRALISSDQKLVDAANLVLKKINTGAQDKITGLPVNSGTATRARWVSSFFSYLLRAPAFKGKAPNDKSYQETHVIK